MAKPDRSPEASEKVLLKAGFKEPKWAEHLNNDIFIRKQKLNCCD